MQTDTKILNIPNTITLMNFLMGIVAILFLSNENMAYFIYSFIACLILDSLDGWYARSFNCETRFGKKFDAFADVFSFGFIITFLIYFRIFNNPPFWQILLAGWITVANVIRYFKLVANKGSKVYGVPNLAVSIFIVSLYMQDLFKISQDQWCYIIVFLSVLMLLPIEFINHKSVKSNLLPNKRLNLIVFFTPLVGILCIESSFFWLIVLLSSGIYIGYILLFIPNFIVRLIQLTNDREHSRLDRVYVLQYYVYMISALSTVVLRIVEFKVL